MFKTVISNLFSTEKYFWQIVVVLCFVFCALLSIFEPHNVDQNRESANKQQTSQEEGGISLPSQVHIYVPLPAMPPGQ